MQIDKQECKSLNSFKFFVIGAARSGINAAKILKKFGAFVFVSENREISKEIENELIKHEIFFESGGHSYQKILKECDVLVLSPGISLHSEIVLLAKKHQIIVVSEIEIASWFLDQNIFCLGITGTNGKSTTTNYTSQLFRRAGWNAFACGNIGQSFSQVLLDSHALSNDLTKNLYVLELSSYQLETTYSFRPFCTAILNLQNDHLERYENIYEYLKAKWRLVLMTHDDGLAILDEEVLFMAVKMGLVLPRCRVVVMTTQKSDPKYFKAHQNLIREKTSSGRNLPVSIYHGIKNLNLKDLIYESNLDIISCQYDQGKNSVEVFFQGNNSDAIWRVENSCLSGEHNSLNILCASLMAKHLGISDEVILLQWESKTTAYEHLPHRLERIGLKEQKFIDINHNVKRVTIVNDSKATNMESTFVALKSFQEPIRLLLGGQPKGDSYLPLINFIGHGLIKIYPFGKAGNLIASELNSCGHAVSQPQPHLIQAAELALSECQDGEVLLLSPGCSSFDEFKDFEHRGNTFRNWAISCFKGNAN